MKTARCSVHYKQRVISGNYLTNILHRKRKTDWRNAILLRSIMEMLTYQPLLSASKIDEKIKVLYVIASKDDICPNHRTKWAYNQTKNGQLVEIESTHMEIYGIKFKDAVQKQIEFLRNELR